MVTVCTNFLPGYSMIFRCLWDKLQFENFFWIRKWEPEIQGASCMNLWSLKVHHAWTSDHSRCIMHELVITQGASCMNLWSLKVHHAWTCDHSRCIMHELVITQLLDVSRREHAETSKILHCEHRNCVHALKKLLYVVFRKHHSMPHHLIRKVYSMV